MKKLILLAVMALMMPTVANAQLGGMLEKAARKAAGKVVDKATDKASDRVSKALENEVDKLNDNNKAVEPAAEGATTYESLMRQMPELPSADQLVKHKEAELNNKAIKLVTSKVTIFTAKVLDLSSRVATIGYEGMDSAQMSEAAYRYAEQTTGMSREELEKLSTMSEEQQAYIMSHYESGKAETAMTRQAVEASKWLEPIQPMIDQWAAAGEKADKAYEDMAVKLRPIYKKYAAKLAKATETERVNLLISYYTEAVPHIRTAVQNAINVRLNEQLPLAEKIEEEMAKIRTEYPDAISQLLCYPKLTATQYFTEVSRLLEIPEYQED